MLTLHINKYGRGRDILQETYGGEEIIVPALRGHL